MSIHKLSEQCETIKLQIQVDDHRVGSLMILVYRSREYSRQILPGMSVPILLQPDQTESEELFSLDGGDLDQ